MGFGIGTKLLMFDGTTKNVEDIVIGDIFIGEDSTPRNVTSMLMGVDDMYKIIPTKGNSYIVSQSHKLSLVLTDKPKIIYSEARNNYSLRYVNLKVNVNLFFFV